MAMVVRSNLMAYNANRQLGMNNSAVSKNLEKLSSGFKINRAADDAAGLAISEKMKAQIKGLETASANSQDGISLVQTAEGALTEVHDMLNRMTELATKSANGTIQDEVDREAIQNEVNKLNDEIDRISDSTNFNGIKLLDGSLGGGGGVGASKTAKLETSDILKTENAFVVNAATKGKYVMSGAVAAGVTNKTNEYTFTYRNADGESKDISISISNTGNGNAFTYKVNGGEEKTSTATASNAVPPTGDMATVIKEALADTELGELFDVSQAAGVITFEAKEAGASKAEILLMKSVVDVGGVNTTAALTATGANTATGTDEYNSLDVSKIFHYDAATAATAAPGQATTDASKAVFTVDGKKFAVAATGQKAAAQAAFGDDVTIIEFAFANAGDALAAGDQEELVKAINIKLGYEAATTDLTGTEIDFKAVAGKAGNSGNGLTLQIGDTGEDFNQVTVAVDNMSSKGIGTNNLKVDNQTSAKDAIETIKKAINKVSTNRSEMGALQNRLEHTINNLDVAAENMTNANSRIRDTDMAKQMMEYTKMNVLTQSAQAMLAQANQNPQSILQLLQ